MSKIIAHRGASKAAPQNTIPAFKKGIEFGCDGFENDVHLTKDGVVVICHNYEVDETSSGSGKIADMTFDELRKLDFGSYFSPEFAGTKIPTLDEFLDLCSAVEIINIEIKEPLNGSMAIVPKTIDAVKAHGLFDKLIVSSFDPRTLLECKKYDSACKTALLYDPRCKIFGEVEPDPVGYVKKLGCEAVHPHFIMVDEDYINAFHAAGIAVNAWTVDSEQALASLSAMGCDGLITNVPDFAAKVLNR